MTDNPQMDDMIKWVAFSDAIEQLNKDATRFRRIAETLRSDRLRTSTQRFMFADYAIQCATEAEAAAEAACNKGF